MVVFKTLFLYKLTFFNRNNYQTIHVISNEAKKRSIEAKAVYIPYIRNKNGVFGLLSVFIKCLLMKFIILNYQLLVVFLNNLMSLIRLSLKELRVSISFYEVIGILIRDREIIEKYRYSLKCSIGNQPKLNN